MTVEKEIDCDGSIQEWSPTCSITLKFGEEVNQFRSVLYEDISYGLGLTRICNKYLW